MIKSNIKLFIGVSVLLAYISIGVFGLFKLDHKIEMPMDNCPYTQNGYAICENSLDHINNWRQFSNGTFSSILILSFLALGLVLYFLNTRSFLNQEEYFYKWKYYLYSKKLFRKKEIIIKWLSLFENSPASIRVRHS